MSEARVSSSKVKLHMSEASGYNLKIRKTSVNEDGESQHLSRWNANLFRKVCGIPYTLRVYIHGKKVFSPNYHSHLKSPTLTHFDAFRHDSTRFDPKWNNTSLTQIGCFFALPKVWLIWQRLPQGQKRPKRPALYLTRPSWLQFYIIYNALLLHCTVVWNQLSSTSALENREEARLSFGNLESCFYVLLWS